MLQEFLNAQLLPITDEVYFGKLQKVSEALAKSLQKNKSKVLTYTLTALDPDVSVDDPNISEVKELITKNWNTFATNSNDTPVTFIRALMLEALKNVSNETTNACIIWLASRNIIKYFNLTGKEKDLILRFLMSLGNEVEKKAVESWALPSEAKLHKLSVEIKELTGVTIDKAILQTKMEEASGPTNAAGVPNTSPNPHWSNSAPHWSYQFAPRAAQGK